MDPVAMYQLSCIHWKTLIQNGINLKFPIGTEMLNEGLQTKDLFKMERFSAGGCFKRVWLVTEMKQRVLEENCCVGMVTRNIYFVLNYELYQERKKDIRKVKSSKHVVALCC